MSLKLKFHQKLIAPKNLMSLKLKCHQNWMVINSEMSLKVKCDLNWNLLNMIGFVLNSTWFVSYIKGFKPKENWISGMAQIIKICT